MKKAVMGVVLAAQFLTKIPIPVVCPWNGPTLKWAMRSYGLIGLVLGALLALGAAAVAVWMPLWMASLFIVTLWVALTGGLHLDGWADTADASGSYAPLEKKWEIMKDPRIGASGTIALLLLLLWKTALVYAYLEHAGGVSWVALLPMVLIPALARWGGLLLLYVLPPAKPSGIAWEWKQHLTRADLAFSMLPVALFAAVWIGLSVGVGPGWPGEGGETAEGLHSVSAYAGSAAGAVAGVPLIVLLLFVGFALFMAGYWLWVRTAFQAVNGDLTGACIEGGEAWLLGCLWISTLFVMG